MASIDETICNAAVRGECVQFPDPGVTVPATVMRDVILGLHPILWGKYNGRRIQGVKLEGATIVGVIQLRDCSGPDGGALAPLLLHRCVLAGDREQPSQPAIDARHARLAHLSLSGSKVRSVDLSDATLGGDLDIDQLSPIDDEQPCQVLARHCHINGSVLAQGAHLRIPDGQQLAEFGIPDYALNLFGAVVDGSLHLQPKFRASGGVNVAGASIRGDIWAECASLSAANSIAFRAQSLRCQGVVALRGAIVSGDGRPCEMKGSVDFMGASVGFLDMCGIQIKPSAALPVADQDGEALRLNFARIEQALLLRSDENLRTVLEGTISANSVAIGGDADLRGIAFDLSSEGDGRALTATNARIGGDLLLSGVAAAVSLAGTRIDKDLNVEKVGSGGPADRTGAIRAQR